ncbi:hypothetical protein ACFV4K_14960 [Nocardia sp. NPDC059764]|uniref:hypothetical protein n=1 Tax=Nocardia sp. NPDC059764 TaxID=3346939 RepID=UPI003669532C
MAIGIAAIAAIPAAAANLANLVRELFLSVMIRLQNAVPTGWNSTRFRRTSEVVAV